MVPELTIAYALNELVKDEVFVDTKRAFLTGFLVAHGISTAAIPNAITGEFQSDEAMKAEKTINRTFRNRDVLSLAEENTKPSQQQHKRNKQ